MDFYEPAELERVLARSAGILGIELGAEAGAEIARLVERRESPTGCCAVCATMPRSAPTG